MKKIVFTLILFLSLTTSLFARTWTVRTTGGDFTTLNAALINVDLTNGDIIDMLGDFTTDTTLTIKKSITIQGGGPANTSLTRTGTINVKRLMIVNALAGDVVFKNLTLMQAAYTGTDVGMGLNVIGGAAGLNSITVDNVVFKNFNSGGQAAGAVWLTNVKRSRITNCEFINNKTNSVGGAIQVSGLSTGGSGINKTVIENCTFEENHANGTNSGHAIIANYTNATPSADSIVINNCTFYKNGTTVGAGSTIRLQYNGAKIIVSNCTFANNNALSTAADIFTNNATNSIAAELTVQGNLFYKSGGLIVHSSWPGYSWYNLSTSTMNAGVIMDKVQNYGTLAADMTGGIQVEFNAITNFAVLANNGGMVRTIKLLESTNTENQAIDFVIQPLNRTDARGLPRPTTTNDCGAYEHQKNTGLKSLGKLNDLKCFYNSTDSKIHFDKKLTGTISVFSANGSLLLNSKLDNSSELFLGSVKGFYVANILTKEGGFVAKVIVK